MIGNAQRRFYRFFIVAATCFLFAILLYDLTDMHILATLAASISGILAFIGCVLGFIAFEALSYPDDYDRTDEFHPSRHYAFALYTIAAIMALLTVFLLIWILTQRRPMLQEQLVILWGPFQIGFCLLFGHRAYDAQE